MNVKCIIEASPLAFLLLYNLLILKNILTEIHKFQPSLRIYLQILKSYGLNN